jgi:hypothetical protein
MVKYTVKLTCCTGICEGIQILHNKNIWGGKFGIALA